MPKSNNYPSLSKLIKFMEDHAPGSAAGEYEFPWPKNVVILEQIASRFNDSQLETVATGCDENGDEEGYKALMAESPELGRVTAFLNAVFEGDFSNKHFKTRFAKQA